MIPVIICILIAIAQIIFVTIPPLLPVFLEIVVIPIYLSMVGRKNGKNIILILLNYLIVIGISLLCIGIRAISMYDNISFLTSNTETVMVIKTEMIFSVMLSTLIWVIYFVMYIFKKHRIK